MERVSVTRRIDAPPAAVEAAVADLESFMLAAGFDDVSVEGGTVDIENAVGLARLSLTVEVVEADAALAYEQREGLFSEMRTRYEVAPADGGSEVTATTEFELGRGVVGSALDATLVKRQRRSELTRQLEGLSELVAGEHDDG